MRLKSVLFPINLIKGGNMKHTIRKMLVTGMISGLLSLSAVSAVYAANGWKESNGTWTYLDDNGQLHKSWLPSSNGYYYMDLSTGVMVTGWKKIDSKWYYVKSNGIILQFRKDVYIMESNRRHLLLFQC